MQVGFEGIGRVVATFACKEEEENSVIKIGDVVSMSGNGEVKKAAAKDLPAGVCVSRNGGYAGVQLKGAVTLPYTGTAPQVGYNILAADGNNGVTVSTTGLQRLVLAVDTANTSATILL